MHESSPNAHLVYALARAFTYPEGGVAETLEPLAAVAAQMRAESGEGDVRAGDELVSDERVSDATSQAREDGERVSDVRAGDAASQAAQTSQARETNDEDLAARLDNLFEASRCFEDPTAEKLAYTRLFIGSLRMEAPPYASYYLERDHTLNGAVAAEVAAVYRQFGLKLEDSENAPADHLRYLLHFLALLAQRFEETGEEAFAEAYRDFRDAYLAPWYPTFAKLVATNAEEPYYPALVSFIGDVL